jgi:hypothetical protein
MVTWGELAEARPDLAEAGQALLYQLGVGLAFLATTRRDGAPRVHPMCPILHDDGLYAFIVPSPKRDDLHRDGRYAMHSFPTDDNEDAFSITGRAEVVHDQLTVQQLARRFADERGMSDPPPDVDTWEPFAFQLGSCLLTRTTGHGDPEPRHTIWRATRA